MTQVTIELPDDLARRLESIAAAQQMSIEQLALEHLRSFASAGSPAAILRAISEPPHLSASDVDDLEAALADARLPVREQGTSGSPPPPWPWVQPW